MVHPEENPAARTPTPSPPHTLPRSIRLSGSGTLAELRADDLTEAGVVLTIDGVEQSHVETDDPGWLLHDYTVRIGAVLDALGDEAASTRGRRVLHLGAGALTLPRWVEHRAAERHLPAPEQIVLDLEPELMDFVLETLPMRTRPHTIVADAAAALAPGGALAGRHHDAVVVDLFNSADAPEAVTSTQFCRRLGAIVAPGGVLVMNLGDEPGLAFARPLISRLVAGAGAADAARCLVTAPADVLDGAVAGNLVVAVADAPIRSRAAEAVWAAGPHPCEVLSGHELQIWLAAQEGSANQT
ncbi:spermidine synthase [Nesterenkonia xinjiangensis]|uniref:Spermidine synthase n=1 Tax=Nesterenkonia xinjiangensis TaxID=225327 RepID=A0A7Z0GNS5_9MICC|nr:fused MFS/spermidine synthase [Nesterenkonia xinjiangensis]NYJ79332.1 spermidine synthase [Nesterenkonia xinjiangensis]